jgi:hypothetical protein
MKQTTLFLIIVTAILAGVSSQIIVAATLVSTPILSAVTPAEAQTMLDHASRQTDRWLFLAASTAFNVCLIIAVAYQTKWVRNLVSELRQDRSDLGGIIQANSDVMTRVKDRLDRVMQ